MTTDAKSLQRTAQRPVAWFRRCRGGAVFDSPWDKTLETIAMVASVTHNAGSRPNQATLLFADLRWHLTYDLNPGDRVRIGLGTVVLFDGVLTSWRAGFFGGDKDQGGWERNTMVAKDFRWLLNATSVLYGQYSRGPDDFTNFGTPSQSPITNATTPLNGQRCIFNPGGKPNRDPVDLTLSSAPGRATSCPLFCPPAYQAPSGSGDAQYWTVGQMIHYCLVAGYSAYWTPIMPSNPALMTGLDHSDFDAVLSGQTVEGLGVIEAVAHLAKQIGWSVRQADGLLGPTLEFFKPGRAAGTERTAASPTILHDLYAPAVASDLAAAVQRGEKLLLAGEMIQDIESVVNAPIGVGAPDVVEITAELVPAWEDADLVPDSASSYANVYKTEAELAEEANPNGLSFFAYYHARGSSFLRDVGRKWALNEAGTYSLAPYLRGLPFDFSGVVPDSILKDADGKLIIGLFKRQLLPCLTFDKDTLNPAAIKVEFSFNGGSSWQTIPCTIENLTSEAGIRITEPNLSDIIPLPLVTISDALSPLEGKELNYWTCLSDDKLQTRLFADGEWDTRVRVTATIQLDRRIQSVGVPSAASGSPLLQTALYDWSDKYTRQVRTSSSTYYSSGLPAWDTDQSDTLATHLDRVRAANEDAAINGAFTLDRLWIDAADAPTFRVGDGIFKVGGREVSLYAARQAGSGNAEPMGVYPEIIQITYDIEKQTQTLVTRDLRLAVNP